MKKLLFAVLMGLVTSGVQAKETFSKDTGGKIISINTYTDQELADREAQIDKDIFNLQSTIDNLNLRLVELQKSLTQKQAEKASIQTVK